MGSMAGWSFIMEFKYLPLEMDYHMVFTLSFTRSASKFLDINPAQSLKHLSTPL